jgi:hypothetical protein
MDHQSQERLAVGIVEERNCIYVQLKQAEIVYESFQNLFLCIIFKFVSFVHLHLLPVGVKGYCCAWSHSMFQTHSVGLLWARNLPVAENSTYTKQNICKWQTSMILVGFEPAVPASEWPQALSLDCVATRIGLTFQCGYQFTNFPHL